MLVVDLPEIEALVHKDYEVEHSVVRHQVLLEIGHIDPVFH